MKYLVIIQAAEIFISMMHHGKYQIVDANKHKITRNSYH